MSLGFNCYHVIFEFQWAINQNETLARLLIMQKWRREGSLKINQRQMVSVTSLDKSIFVPAIWLWCKISTQYHNSVYIHNFFLLFTSKSRKEKIHFQRSFIFPYLSCSLRDMRRVEGQKTSEKENISKELASISRKVSIETTHRKEKEEEERNLSLFLSSWNRIQFFSPAPLVCCLPLLFKKQH